ncbi:hypothetical protein LTR53_000622 [Teratosphaeriaceae sp. CCFEE 6253]|nr:hypothetical protein LTR53_000622 [Teratosphaeriaceae sp. CCFEE 6253]
MQDFQELFGSSTFADITLRFGGRNLPAHRLLLAKGSDYFKAMLESEFETGADGAAVKEAEASTITLHGDSPAALESLIGTFYGRSAYDKDVPDSDAECYFRVVRAVDLYVAASKYLVPAVCTEIASVFPGILRAVKDGSLYSFDMARVVRHVYLTHAGAADDLKVPIVAMIAVDIDEWKKSANFESLIAAVPDLAVSVMSQLAGAKPQTATKRSRKAAGDPEEMAESKRQCPGRVAGAFTRSALEDK